MKTSLSCVIGLTHGSFHARWNAAPSARYFLPRIASFAALERRNLRTFLAGILIDSPVEALRLLRARRFTNTSLPSPGREKPFSASSCCKSRNAARASDKVTLVPSRGGFWIGRTLGMECTITHLPRGARLPSGGFCAAPGRHTEADACWLYAGASGAGGAFLRREVLLRRLISSTCGTRSAFAGSRTSCIPIE